MIKLAVFGDPIEHSLSPFIHAAFAEQTGVAVDYTRIHAPAAEFKQAFSQFVAAGGVGANITLPLKQLALELVDRLLPEAVYAGAVNTLIKKQQTWLGTNTDGIGLVRDLQRLGINLQDAQVLLVGAGGAARGAIPALLAEHVASVHVVNRTPERAQELIKDVSQYVFGPRSLQQSAQCLTAGGFEQLTAAGFNLIINATATGLYGQSLPLTANVFAAKPLCYDMVYGKQATPFMQQAAQYGCTTADGLGMLVEQAAASFLLWTGVAPETACLLQQLRQQLR